MQEVVPISGVVAFSFPDPEHAHLLMRAFIDEGTSVRRFASLAEMEAARPDGSIVAMVAESSDDSIDFCHRLRLEEKGRMLPLVMVQPTSRPHDCAQILLAGADSCLSTDASSGLVLASVKAVLRRSNWAKPDYASSSVPAEHAGRGVRVDYAGFTATLDGKLLDLTTSELRILIVLGKNASRIVSREELFKAIKHTLERVTDRSLDSHVYMLRKKLGEAGVSLKTLRGLGYRWDETTTPIHFDTR